MTVATDRHDERVDDRLDDARVRGRLHEPVEA